MSNRFFAALIALPLLAGVTVAAQAQPNCLRKGDINGFSAIKGNDRAFVITDRANRRYKITTTYRCPGIDFNMAVGIKTLETGRLACVSRGDTVISRDPGVAGDQCPIASVQPYTPDMERADRARAEQAQR